jgi:hypothetical protein
VRGDAVGAEIDLARRVCLTFPEAVEQEAWGEPTFRVRKRMFAMFASAGNHHGAGGWSLWVNAPLGVQELLVRESPDRFFVPPYVGVKGWVGVRLEGLDDDQLRPHVLGSYCMVAPDKLVKLVPG